MSLSSNQSVGQGRRGAGQTPFSGAPLGARPSGPLTRTPNEGFPVSGQAEAQTSNAFAWGAEYTFPGDPREAHPGGSPTQKPEERKPQTLRPKSKSSVGRNLFLDVPIAGRLA